MKRENLSRAIECENLITRFEKIMELNTFAGVSATEVSLLMSDIGIQKIKPLIADRIEELSKELENL